MKRFLLLSIASMIAFCSMNAKVYVNEDSVTVVAEVAGNLEQDIKKLDIPKIGKLSVAGPINSADLKFLNNQEEETLSELKVLNLQDATVQADGQAYATIEVGNDLYRETTTFYLSEEEEKLVIDKNVYTMLGQQFTYQSHYSHDLAAAFIYSKIKHIILPSELKSVGSRLAYDSEIESITLPLNIKEVKDYAFEYASYIKAWHGLEQLKLEAIGDNAFAGTNLAKIDLSHARKLGYRSFSGTLLREADLSSTDSIPYGAFSGCKNLSTVTFAKNLDFIGQEAFKGCNLSQVSIPETAKHIASNSFDDTPFINNQLTNNGIAYINNLLVTIKPLTDGQHFDIREGTEVIASKCSDSYSKKFSITLPASLKIIEPNAFEYSNITSVKLTETLDSIGDDAFYYCEKLQDVDYQLSENCRVGTSLFYNSGVKEVKVGKHVTRLNNGAFAECKDLQRVTFEERDPEMPFMLGDRAFYYCTSLQEIALPEHTDSIGEDALQNTKLISFTVPKQVKKIGYAAFYEAGVDTLTIPEEVDAYANYAFWESSFKNIIYKARNLSGGCVFGDSQVENLYIGKKVARLNDFDFGDCRKLKSIEYEERPDGDSLYFSEMVFSGDTQLEKFTFPAFATGYVQSRPNTEVLELHAPKLQSYATSGWSKLKKVIIGKEVRSVPRYLGADSPNLEEVVFEPRSATDTLYFEPVAFSGCPKLKHIDLPEGTTVVNGFNLTGLESVKIPSTVKEIAYIAFYQCDSLREVTFANRPDKTPLDIADAAFGYCPLLTSVALPEGTRSLNGFNRSGIQQITIPSTVTTICDGAFSGCSSLQKVDFAERDSNLPLTLERNAFYNCGMLDSISLPEGTTTIGDYCFEKSAIKKLHLPTTLTYLGKYVCWGCDQLESLIFDQQAPSNNTIIGEGAFYECNSLREAVLNEGITEIGRYTFMHCKNLEHVSELPSSLDKLGDSGFCDTAIRTVKIPANLSYLGRTAFLNCANLESVQYEKRDLSKPLTIKSGAFCGCPLLKEMIFPEGVTDIEDDMFHNTSVTTVSLPSTLTNLDGQMGYYHELDTIYNYRPTPILVTEYDRFHSGLKENHGTILAVLPGSVDAYKKAPYWRLCTVVEMDEAHISMDVKTPEIDGTSAPAAIFTMDGRRVQQPGTGLYIYRSKDGKTRKQYIKK